MTSTSLADHATVSPPAPPVTAAFTPISLSDAELARALEAGNTLSPWFRTEERINTDMEHLPKDRTAWVEQIEGPAIGCFDVRRSGPQVEVDHYPIIYDELRGEISSVGLFESIEAAFSGIAAWLRVELTPAFLAA